MELAGPRGHWPLAILVVAFIVLGSFYNISNPIFEAPDELWHYRFINHLRSGGGLPVLYEDPEMNVAGQEGGQPPLYYTIASLATSGVSAGDLEAVTIVNPQQGRGSEPNLLVHTAREDFPYRGTTLAVHLVRGLSTLMGTATVLLTYLVALEALKGRRHLALSAAAVTALNPQFLFISASVSNDNLVTLVSVLVLFLVLRGVNRGFPLSHSVILGAALAAAALSKVSGLALFPLALAALGLRAWREHSPASLRALFILTPMMAVGAGWWFARNWALYGDPLGLGPFIAASGGHAPAITLGSLLAEIQRVWVSYWALFGWSNVPAAPGFYLIYGALCLVGILGLWRLVTSEFSSARRRLPAGPAAPAAILVLWVGAYALLLLQYMRITTGMQGRLLFPALPAVSVLLAAGLFGLVPDRWLRRVPAALGLALAIPAFLAPILYISPAYPKIRLLDDAQAREIPQLVDVSYGGAIQLRGYRLKDRELRPGQPMEITLYWRALSSPGKNLTVFLHAFDPWGNKLGQVDSLLGENGYPTAAWRAGDILEETYSLPLQEPQDRPSVVRIEAGLYLFPSMERLQAVDSLERTLGTSVPFLRAKAPAPSPPKLPFPGLELPLGPEILLVGYQLAGEEAGGRGFLAQQQGRDNPSYPPDPDHSGQGADRVLRPGQTLEGRLWWKAAERPTRDYSVFVQLLGPDGLVAQYDSQPRAGSYPTSWWDQGETVEDRFRLVIPDQARPGAYRLIAGMYDPISSLRLMGPGQDYLLLRQARIGQSE